MWIYATTTGNYNKIATYIPIQEIVQNKENMQYVDEKIVLIYPLGEATLGHEKIIRI
jgi:hypothetical protein